MLNIKFHPSQLDALMTHSRYKDLLSETTKSILRDIWIEHQYGRKKDIRTPQMSKGTMCEAEAFRLLHQTNNGIYVKNKKTLENDYLIGTPDAIKEEHGLDIKNAWDLWTFAAVNQKMVEKTYYYQMLGYMILTGLKWWKVAYCLVDTPNELVVDEMQKKERSFPELGVQQLEDKFLNHYKFGDISAEKRVKLYTFEFSEGDAEELEGRVKLWREYIDSLTL